MESAARGSAGGTLRRAILRPTKPWRTEAYDAPSVMDDIAARSRKRNEAAWRCQTCIPATVSDRIWVGNCRKVLGLICRSQSWWRTAASVESGTPSVRRPRSTLGSRLARFPKLAIRSRLARAHTQNLNNVTDRAQHFVKAARSACVPVQRRIPRINRVW